MMTSFQRLPLSEVGRIKDLWEKNRIYHEGIDPHFGHLYADLVFEKRMKPLLERPEETVLLTIATKGERTVGYCLSIREGDEAELVSMHVASDCRGGGIGKALVRVHLAWMKDHGCRHIGVTVAHANPETIAFYRSVGFLPNTLSMMQPINR